MSSFEMLGKDPRNTVIKVIGVGGGGGNAVQYMVDQGADGIEFIAANTDHQALAMNKAHVLLQLGESGLGAGANPQVGEKAAIDSTEKIRDAVSGAHLLFITAGMGGGTGTGAAPVIAKIAKEEGILTVGVVTKPFSYEGTARKQRAEEGIAHLKEYVDSLIVILNDRLEDEFGEDATMEECFNAANDVLYKACHGIAEIIHTPGLINVDFNDLSTVMREHGTALMGSATASGPNRAEEAAKLAVSSPLLEGSDLTGARGLLVYVTASNSLKLSEPRKVMKVLSDFVSKGANVIFGSARDDSLGDELRVTVVATGMDSPLTEQEKAQTGMRPDNMWTGIFSGSPAQADQPAQPAQPAPQAAAAPAPRAPEPVKAAPAPEMPHFAADPTPAAPKHEAAPAAVAPHFEHKTGETAPLFGAQPLETPAAAPAAGGGRTHQGRRRAVQRLPARDRAHPGASAGGAPPARDGASRRVPGERLHDLPQRVPHGGRRRRADGQADGPREGDDAAGV